MSHMTSLHYLTLYTTRDVRANLLGIRHNDSLFTQEKEPHEKDVILRQLLYLVGVTPQIHYYTLFWAMPNRKRFNFLS